MEKETKEKFVRTKNVVRQTQFINECIDRREWAAIIGHPGTGKSEIKKELVRFYSAYPEKYIVIEMPVFFSTQMRIGSIMKAMIEAIDPDVLVPQNANTKYRLLRNVLIEAVAARKKVVLFFDETHFLSHNAVRELKMIWEIEGLGRRNLFSMIMFLKPTTRFDTIFGTSEIGKRIMISRMQPPTPAEIFEMASDLGLKFKDDSAKSEFLIATKRLPLGVRYLARTLYRNADFNGVVTTVALTDAKHEGIKEDLREYGISNRLLYQRMKAKGIEVSLGALNQALNNKNPESKQQSKLAAFARTTLDEIIEEKRALDVEGPVTK